ncbi:MAG: PorT family protein [Bacteroidales bacterium]|nr:PorT family protein [Bacteroidales bacterium]
MRKIGIYFFTFLMVLCTSNIYAQIRIGAKAGLNVANASTSGTIDTKSKLGIHLGGVAEYEIMDALYAQGGILLSQKGYKYELDLSGPGYTYTEESKISLFYIDIPLTAVYKFELGDMSIYGTGGFNIGMGLSGKYKYEENDDGNITSGETDLDWGSGNTDDIKRMDLGFIVGAGVEINEAIQVGLSYNIGLNNLLPVSGVEAKNRVFAITISYFLTEF